MTPDDFNTALRRALDDFGDALVALLRPGFDAALRNSSDDVNAMFHPHRERDGTRRSESASELRRRHRTAVHSAAHGYVEWAATLIVKKGRVPPRRSIPHPSNATRRRIATRAGCPPEIFDQVLAALPQMASIPLLGQVVPETGEVMPDVVQLYEWSSCYDPRSTHCSPVPSALERRGRRRDD